MVVVVVVSPGRVVVVVVVVVVSVGWNSSSIAGVGELVSVASSVRDAEIRYEYDPGVSAFRITSRN